MSEMPRIEIIDVHSSIVIRAVEKEGAIIKQNCNIARIDYNDGYLDKEQALSWANKIVNYHKKEWENSKEIKAICGEQDGS